ncbi:hypothetical protein ACSAZL_06580 [Methanosarcina sp. T3]|uniref:hypothetical protein n=1 Tax=Methanosarcina sp. T3 TaxID=3439062 RepID=UPI003F827EFA
MQALSFSPVIYCTTRKFGWTKNVLIVQIENDTYEKTLLDQTNFEITLPAEIKSQAKLAIKDEYTFYFLELGDRYSEKELEKEIFLKPELSCVKCEECSPL